MKKTFLELTIIIICSIIIGCVPYNTTFTNNEILGRRSGEPPNRDVKIERRKKEVHAIALLSPEGIGTKATIVSTYNYYLIEPDGKEKSLSHINKSGTDYAYLHEILPVSNTALWVAFWLEGDAVRREYVDLNVIVFDESRVIHRNYIKDSIRTKTCAWEYSSSYSVLPLDGNRKIQFNTKDGTTIYDTLENNFE